MRRIYNDEKEKLIRYLYHEPYYCTFILGDIDNYGLDGDVVKVFADEHDGDINFVLMNYDTDFVVYSFSEFDANNAAKTIKKLVTDPYYCISGKNSTINHLSLFMQDMCQRNTNIATYDLEFPPKYCNNKYCSRILTSDNAQELLDLYLSIEEFYDKYKNYTVERMKRTFEGSTIVGVYNKEGLLLGSAATTAENNLGAMIVNVCSHKCYRGNGIAQLAVSNLLKILKEKGLGLISLYYDNPYAGRLYHKLGFVDKGIYSTLRKDTK